MDDDRQRQHLAADQLSRMRGMTVEYHRQFFIDVRFAILLIVALFVLALWADPLIALLIPFVALWTAVQTAFDASYLMFARHYAVRLEEYLNHTIGERLLVGGRLEAEYLFPLNQRKIVTIAAGRGFSWFGYVTVFFTLLGIAAYLFGLGIGWVALSDIGDPWQSLYVATLVFLTLTSLIVGVWWFVMGTGEQRLTAVLDGFAEPRT